MEMNAPAGSNAPMLSALLPNFQAIYRIVYAGHHRILAVARL